MDKVSERNQESATLLRDALMHAVDEAEAAENVPFLSDFLSPIFTDWVTIQSEDLITHSDPIRKFQEKFSGTENDQIKHRFQRSEALIENLTTRTRRLVQLRDEACDLNALSNELRSLISEKQADMLELDSGQRTSEYLKTTGSLMASISTQAKEIGGKTKVLSSKLQADSTERLIKAAHADRRPIKDALVTELEAMQSFVTSIDNSLAVEGISEPIDVPAAGAIQAEEDDAAENETQGISAPNPLIQQRRKELGGALSAGEVIRRTEVYFKSLWAEGIEQRHCGAILVFEPSVSRGINIHDLLGLSNTDSMLDQAKTQIMARFAHRD